MGITRVNISRILSPKSLSLFPDKPELVALTRCLRSKYSASGSDFVKNVQMEMVSCISMLLKNITWNAEQPC